MLSSLSMFALSVLSRLNRTIRILSKKLIFYQGLSLPRRANLVALPSHARFTFVTIRNHVKVAILIVSAVAGMSMASCALARAASRFGLRVISRGPIATTQPPASTLKTT